MLVRRTARTVTADNPEAVSSQAVRVWAKNWRLLGRVN